MIDTTPCPDCRQPLAGGPACPHCGLTLTGPTAGRLWQVDQRLAVLDGEQRALRDERISLLAVLRGSAPAAPVVTAPATGPAAVTSRPEASTTSVQNTLLTLGALLLAVAALVFGAVTYSHLGTAGRAAVLLTLTAAAAYAPVPLVRRGLTATAESLSAVAIVLALLDAWALRRAGLAAHGEGTTYAAVALALLAGATAAHARVLPLQVTRVAAVLLVQPVVPLLLVRLDAGPVPSAVALAALAAADVALWLTAALPRPTRVTAAATAGVAQAAALLACAAAVDQEQASAGAALLVVSVVTALAAWSVTGVRREVLGAGSAVLLCGAALAAVHPTFAEVDQGLVLGASALVVLLATQLLPLLERRGPVVGALLVSGGAVLVQADQVLLAVAGPFTWLGSAWSSTASGARESVSTTNLSTATPAVLVVVLLAAGALFAAGVLLERVRDALVPAAVLVLLAGLVVPVSLGTSYALGLAVDVLLVASVVGTALVMQQRHHRSATVLACAALVPALVAATWSLADQTATLVVLPCLAVLAGVAALVAPAATGVALVLVGAELAAAGAAGGLTTAGVGSLLVAATAVAVVATFLLRGTNRVAAEVAAAVLAGSSVLLSVEDVDALSWTLAVSGLLALLVAVRPDRRVVGIGGGLLLSASSWVRLADAGVRAPEPYVLPLAVAALVAGHLRRRANPRIGSLEAYGTGLSLALVPVLLRSIADDSPTRGLLLLVACALVVLVGAQQRLRAPLLLGGAVLVVDALVLLAPYAAALPRWTVLATVGGGLVAVGATYEQRRRDLERVRGELAQWA